MRHWRLTIDIREIDSDYTAVIFSLFNWDNSKMLRHVKRVEREMVSDWVRRAKGCFMDTDRRGLGRELAVLAEDLSRDLELPSTVNKWFQSPLLDTNSTLLIDSLHTNIPWDLLPTGSSHGGAWSGEYLGHKFAIGLQVPTVDADYFFSTQPSGRPRADPREAGKPIFLHVLANPRNDLRTLEMESEKLKEVVEKTGWLDYKAVQEASWGKLVRLISAYGPAIRYFHYSGHVRPKEGLVLSASEGRRPRENLFSIQAIRSRLAGTSLDIAFLNGCDETYVDVDEKGFSSWNPHDHANVANSFLEAGANGVVAPRSRISDEDAPEAAEMIWSAIFSGKVLGAAVQEYRQKKIGDFPDSIAGYSYVVYGNPGVLVMPEATPAMPSAAPVAGYITEAQPSDPFEGWRLRAEAECGREVGPAQLFAAFTRTWMVGSAFFEALGQAYIQALMDLRLKLG
ncbi:MAG: CHAT domain-containing protein, partial [Pseudomonadota bacterium]